jgi:hypothetical protein
MPAGQAGNPDQALSAAEADARVVDLKRSGLTFEQIGIQLGGLSKQVIHRRFQRAVTLIRATAVDEWRAQQLQEIELDRELARDIANAKHPVVSNGRVFDELDDDGPKLAALAHLAKLRAQEQDVLGLKAAVKSEVSAVVNYTVGGGIDPAKDLT